MPGPDPARLEAGSPGDRPGWYPAAEGLALLALTLPLIVWFRIPELWFVVPFVLVTLLHRRYEEYGLSLDRPGPVLLHAAVCLVVFGGYFLLHYGYGRWYQQATFRPTLPPDFPRLLLDQILVVGLSEEFFFRGYLQTQLNRSWGRPYRFLGAPWGPGLLVSAVLFGLCHLVFGDLAQLKVIFFGIFAGWLRERTGTILVPAVYHGLSNVLLAFMIQSFR